MAQEQLPRTYEDRIKALERQVAALRKATPLNNASLSGVVTVLDGRVESDDYEEGAAGWSLQPNIAEFNDIRLRGGIIGNDALAEPIQIASTSFIENGFGTAVTDEARATSTMPVPAGFSRALVLLMATAGVVNSTATPDYLYLAAAINGDESREMPDLGPAGQWAHVTVAKATMLTGLTDGSEVTVAANVHTQEAAWAANASNRASVEAIAIFLR